MEVPRKHITVEDNYGDEFSVDINPYGNNSVVFSVADAYNSPFVFSSEHSLGNLRNLTNALSEFFAAIDANASEGVS